MMPEEFHHVTVLLHEAVDNLNIKKDGVYVDCTLGGAGHSEAILSQLSEKGHLYAFDQDEVAIKNARHKLAPYVEKKQVTFINTNFRHLREELAVRGILHVDGIVYDLGVSSPQLDEIERGFSYHGDAPLDMRMNQKADFSAYHVVNEYDYHELVKIFYRYGEEKFSKQIARKIEQARREKPIETTGELVELIKAGIPAPARRKGGHPAKRVFQAIRIEVNDELHAIEESIEQAIDCLSVDGRLSVITFHSLEDRLIKTIFREYSKPKETPAGLPVLLEEDEPILSLVNRKPILPSEEEVIANNRARSAKLRVARKNRL